MVALYGLVDAARDAKLYDLIKASPEHAGLFGGPIRPPLDRNALRKRTKKKQGQCPA
jgi:hypothetical protein